MFARIKKELLIVVALIAFGVSAQAQFPGIYTYVEAFNQNPNCSANITVRFTCNDCTGSIETVTATIPPGLNLPIGASCPGSNVLDFTIDLQTPFASTATPDMCNAWNWFGQDVLFDCQGQTAGYRWQGPSPNWIYAYQSTHPIWVEIR